MKMCFNKAMLLILAVLIFGSLDGRASAGKEDSFKPLAFQPIGQNYTRCTTKANASGFHHQSRALKQDFRSVAGSLIGELMDSVLERDKHSEADDGVYVGQIVGGADASPERFNFSTSFMLRQYSFL